jgi:hypothetical protein
VIHVEAKDLSQKRPEILTVAVRIATAAAVPRADIEHSIGSEQIQPAVVIREKLIVGEYELRRRRVRNVGIRGD